LFLVNNSYFPGLLESLESELSESFSKSFISFLSSITHSFSEFVSGNSNELSSLPSNLKVIELFLKLFCIVSAVIISSFHHISLIHLIKYSLSTLNFLSVKDNEFSI